MCLVPRNHFWPSVTAVLRHPMPSSASVDIRHIHGAQLYIIVQTHIHTYIRHTHTHTHIHTHTHACMQTWVLEKELRVLHLDLKGAGRESDSGHDLSIWNFQANSQWHTSSNKATPPNSATLYGPMRVMFIQTTTLAQRFSNEHRWQHYQPG